MMVRMILRWFLIARFHIREWWNPELRRERLRPFGRKPHAQEFDNHEAYMVAMGSWHRAHFAFLRDLPEIKKRIATPWREL